MTEIKSAAEIANENAVTMVVKEPHKKQLNAEMPAVGSMFTALGKRWAVKEVKSRGRVMIRFMGEDASY